MSTRAPTALDAVIFGGGATGLWALDELVRRGYDVVLLEASDLGGGQTVASQGIIHGGLKYSLGGLITPSARAIRDMPLRWRRSLAGEQPPDLRRTRLRSEFCYLWRARGVSGRLSMLGARVGLRVPTEAVADAARPGILASVPGDVARLDEQVIEPGSFIEDLAWQHRERLLQIDARNGLEIESTDPGVVRAVRLIDPESGTPTDLAPRAIVLAAGAGNEMLRRLAGIHGPSMQRRPLHMVLLRGPRLPMVCGHCVEGRSTRLTITSTRDPEDRVVWQIGGQLAETGVERGSAAQIEAARAELDEVLPDLDRDTTQWATYEAVRAEGRGPGGRRPDQAVVERHGTTMTVWPTKLALVPSAVDELVDLLPPPQPAAGSEAAKQLAGWSRPSVALPPWEGQRQWTDEH